MSTSGQETTEHRQTLAELAQATEHASVLPETLDRELAERGSTTNTTHNPRTNDTQEKNQ